MSFYTKPSRDKTVDVTYINPSLPTLWQAVEKQNEGKQIAVIFNGKEKRTAPIGRDAQKYADKIRELTGRTDLDPTDPEKLTDTVKDYLALRGGVVCEDCEISETVPAKDGTVLFCGEKRIKTTELVFKGPTRSIRHP